MTRTLDSPQPGRRRDYNVSAALRCNHSASADVRIAYAKKMKAFSVLLRSRLPRRRRRAWAVDVARNELGASRIKSREKLGVT